MSDSRMNNVTVIRDRVSGPGYEVNVSAVAAAIVERLLSGKLVPNEFTR